MVTNLNDADAGSLRQTIIDSNDAAGPDVIEFDETVLGTIDLTSGQLDIRDALTINGPGADRLTIDANERSRVFDISDGDRTKQTRVEIAGLTITGGRTPRDDDGGGIRSREDLTVTDSIISGNTAGGFGGGISTYTYFFGDVSVTVTNSTISDNTAGVIGGGIHANVYGPAVSVHVTDSTISGNTGGSRGGGINAYYYRSRADVSVTSSTISGNAARFGGGIFAGSFRRGLALRVTSSTISGNTAADSNGGGIDARAVRDADREHSLRQHRW